MAALNGRLPDSMLAYLGWPEADHLRLVPAAAASLNRLAAAFEAEFSKPLYLSDAYRTYAQQVVLKITKGKFAATPGTSNHGRGVAIDAASRINVDGSAEHRWMEANGPTYGWFNPAWAQDYNSNNGEHEPWHWEYNATRDTHPTPAPTPVPTPRKAPTMKIIHNPEQAERWITDGVTKRWVQSASELPDLLHLCEQAESLMLGRYVTDRIPTYTAVGAIDVAALAAAIVKALPPVSGGGLTAAAVTAAVKAGLTTLILRATV